MPQPIRLAFTSLIGAAAFAVSANAAVITGVTATASSQQTIYDRLASHVVDGSGFYAAGGVVDTSPNGTMWLSSGNGSSGGGVDSNTSIVFDLGSLYTLSDTRVWNYNEAYGSDQAGLNRGIASMVVSYATTLNSAFTTLGTFNVNKGSGNSSTDFSTDIAFGNISARYVSFTNLTHFANADNDFFGLSEVVFNGSAVSAVPEPASLALLGAGLIGAGFIRRNRNA